MESETRRAAYSWLAAQNSRLKLLISEHGHPDPFELTGSGQWPTNFAALVMHIMGQQINVGLARVLYGRLATLIPRLELRNRLAAAGGGDELIQSCRQVGPNGTSSDERAGRLGLVSVDVDGPVRRARPLVYIAIAKDWAAR